MRLTILSVGRHKPGPEADLYREYAGRIDDFGKSLSIGPLKTVEVAQSRRGSADERRQHEAGILLTKIGPSGHLIAMEETGKTYTSTDFAALLGRFREAGTSELAFVLGGPDGLGPGATARAGTRLGLGPMTLPHGLARIVLAEQIYRALTILAGHPYHRA